MPDQLSSLFHPSVQQVLPDTVQQLVIPRNNQAIIAVLLYVLRALKRVKVDGTNITVKTI